MGSGSHGQKGVHPGAEGVYSAGRIGLFPGRKGVFPGAEKGHSAGGTGSLQARNAGRRDGDSAPFVPPAERGWGLHSALSLLISLPISLRRLLQMVSRHDDALGHLPARGGGEGFVGLLDLEAVRHHGGERVFLLMATEEINRGF